MMTPVPNQCYSFLSVAKERFVVEEKDTAYLKEDLKNKKMYKGEWLPVTYRI